MGIVYGQRRNDGLLQDIQRLVVGAYEDVDAWPLAGCREARLRRGPLEPNDP